MRLGTAWGMTMTDRPARPAQFCHPTEIRIEPKKRPNSKAFWSLSMKHGDHHLFVNGRLDSYVEVMKEVNRQFARARYTDEQIFMQIGQSAMDVLVNEWAYRLDSSRRIYVAKDDKHEWHHADEVEFVRWYLKQQEKGK